MFAEKLFHWYQENGRSLPWRETGNPYFIWLSEIILQQTRIEQGISYYEHFVKEYPTVRALADASEQQVLKSWQGLGYYSRARNLHASAKYIAYELDSRFPDTYEGILALKGVGRYTAAAIASFAYRLPYPVIDGNVYRFIARLYGIYTPIGTNHAYSEFEQILNKLIDPARPDLFNQAIMDFGSLCCKPTGCDCDNCIFALECVAHQKGTLQQLPIKQPPQKVTNRYFYYFDIRWTTPQDAMLVHQREEKDIWHGLYELPLYESTVAIARRSLRRAATELLTDWLGTKPSRLSMGPCLTHHLTHQTITAQFILVNFDNQPPEIPASFRIINPSEMKYLPVSRLIDRYLSEM
jgi:A/G-specific adenine glycosylase